MLDTKTDRQTHRGTHIWYSFQSPSCLDQNEKLFFLQCILGIKPGKQKYKQSISSELPKQTTYTRTVAHTGISYKTAHPRTAKRITVLFLAIDATFKIQSERYFS